MHHQQRLAAILEFLQQSDNGRLRGGIDAGERFVHEIKIALLRQGAGEKDALLLAAAQVGNLPIGVGQHLHLVEALARDLAIAALAGA